MSTRTLLVLLLLFLGMMIYLEWQRDYVTPPPPAPVAPHIDDPEASPPLEDLPDLPDIAPVPATGTGPDDAPAAPAFVTARRITVLTDTLDVEIDPVGGTITTIRLPRYPVAVNRPDEPFTLLHDEYPQLFVAQSGLLTREQQPAPNHASEYRYDHDLYELAPGADQVEVPLYWEQDGVRVTKTLIFHRGEYVIDVVHEIENRLDEPWQGARYVQLQRTPPLAGSGPGFTNPERYSFEGGAVYSPEDKFQKLPLGDFRGKQLRASFAGGWAAMVQHYFFTAWIPPEEQQHVYTTRVIDHAEAPRYVLAATSPPVQVAPGGSYRFTSRLYSGPKIQNRVDEIAEGLSLTVDYGIFTILSKPLFWALDKIHSLIGNWGWSILILTLLIKLAFYKLTQAQFRSMGKMRKLTPRIQALKERYGDDRQKFGQAMMEIYKKEKVNPLGGCLPILVQIPIFIALYWVLLESVELRQSSFLWIPDLSRPDPYFIMPILNGIFMIATQRLMPTAGMDPMQRRLMQGLPVVFAFLFALFPAGLVLYWAANSGISLAQQWWILRQLDREGTRA